MFFTCSQERIKYKHTVERHTQSRGKNYIPLIIISTVNVFSAIASMKLSTHLELDVASMVFLLCVCKKKNMEISRI